jgi:hypothetical protein
MLLGESGEWWALCYTGRETRINGKQDMSGPAQILRAHFYAMAGVPIPPHAVPQPPLITSITGQGLLWRGTSDAVRYSSPTPTRWNTEKTKEKEMSQSVQENNKALVLKAFGRLQSPEGQTRKNGHAGLALTNTSITQSKMPSRCLTP